jgi:Fe-S oxidoreductase
MATREEMHSTRGRANLLRALISRRLTIDDGRLFSVNGLSSFDPERVDATAAALDLCLACKGCNAECPSGVDMAKLKFAFQAEYYKTHRRQLRDYVFGYFHVTAGLAASVAPISNRLMEVSLIKNLAAKILGITPQRPFPKFSSRRAKILTAKMQTDDKTKTRIILLSDPFARYMEPETEQAAFDILARCGYDIQVLPILGAGASFLSKGFIDEARRHAMRLLDLLNQIDPAGEIPTVGVEPPEIYTFKNDSMDLLPQRQEEINRRTQNVWLLDEYLLRSKEFLDLRVVNKEQLAAPQEIASAKKVLFHPHCHQRAEGPSSDGLPSGTNATLELLRSCGYKVELMDTGCCGMAGTFGYETEHYDVSMKVGELKVFPKIKELGNGRKSNIVIASSGAACRMQIKQGTDVEAIHPIVLVANRINEVASHDER